MPMLVGKNINEMQKMGFKLTADDIYSVNQSSLKDAIVQFGGGCTAELISVEGLIITNHHCGFSRIQAHSSVEHDYLSNGFWAMSKQEELPNPGLTVRFLVRMEDVTVQVLTGVTKEMTESERRKTISASIKEISTKVEAEGVGYVAVIRPMYYGNEYYLFLYGNLAMFAWLVHHLSQLASLEEILITGFGRDILATSRFSVSMPIRIISLRLTLPRTFLISPNDICLSL